jgi:hypothetical protein
MAAFSRNDSHRKAAHSGQCISAVPPRPKKQPQVP